MDSFGKSSASGIISRIKDCRFDPKQLLDWILAKSRTKVFSKSDADAVSEKPNNVKRVDAFCELLEKISSHQPSLFLVVAEAARFIRNDNLATKIEDDILQICLKDPGGNADVKQAQLALFDELQMHLTRLGVSQIQRAEMKSAMKTARSSWTYYQAKDYAVPPKPDCSIAPPKPPMQCHLENNSTFIKINRGYEPKNILASKSVVFLRPPLARTFPAIGSRQIKEQSSIYDNLPISFSKSPPPKPSLSTTWKTTLGSCMTCHLENGASTSKPVLLPSKLKNVVFKGTQTNAFTLKDNGTYSHYDNLPIRTHGIPSRQSSLAATRDFTRILKIGLPRVVDNYLSRTAVEVGIRAMLKYSCKSPKDNPLLLTGSGGIGKTTLLAKILRQQESDRFLKECNIDVVLWLNCVRWNLVFDEASFLKEIVNILSENGITTNIDDNATNLASLTASAFGNRRILFIFDNGFNLDLLKYFLMQCPNYPCCLIITKEVLQAQGSNCSDLFLNIHCTYNITAWSNDEVANILEGINNPHLKIGRLHLETLAEYCKGMPSTAQLLIKLFKDCKTKQDCEKNSNNILRQLDYRKLKRQITTTGDCSKRCNEVIYDNSFRNVFRIIRRRILKDEGKNLWRMFMAFLLFDSEETVRIDDLMILWNLDCPEEALSTIRVFEEYGLVLFTMPGGKAVQVPQIIHAAAVEKLVSQEVSLKSLNWIESLKAIRYNIVMGYCNVAQKTEISFEESSWDSMHNLTQTFKRQNRHLLESIIAQLDGVQWLSLCNRRILSERNTSFIDHLYEFNWQDEIEKASQHYQSPDNRHSYYLFRQILHKMGSIENVVKQLYNFEASDFQNWSFGDLPEEIKSNYKWAKDIIQSSVIGKFDLCFLSYSEDLIQKMMKYNFGLEDIARLLRVASRFGLINIVDSLSLMHQTTVEFPNKSNGRTALSLAAENGHFKIVELLYKRFPEEAEKIDLYKNTALFLAAANGHLESVEFLYEKFPNAIKMADKFGNLPIGVAAANGHLEVVKFLYSKWPDAFQTGGISIFAQKYQESRYPGRMESVVSNLNSPTDMLDECTISSPLSLAAKNGHLEIVKFLTEMCSELGKMRDRYSRTALSLAAEFGHLETVKFLSEKFPDAVKTVDRAFGQTALSWAVRSGCLETVKVLFSKYPDAVKLRNENKETPLTLSAVHGRLPVAMFLYEEFPDAIKSIDKSGRTALAWASQVGSFEMSKFLIGIYPEAAKLQDNFGRTPISLAAEYGHLEVVKLLHEKCPEAKEIADNNNRLPIHFASLNACNQVSQFFVAISQQPEGHSWYTKKIQKFLK